MYIAAQHVFGISTDEYHLLSVGSTPATPRSQQSLQIISHQKFSEFFFGQDILAHDPETDRKLVLLAEELRSRGVDVELYVEDEKHFNFSGQQVAHTVLTIKDLNFREAKAHSDAAAKAVDHKLRLASAVKPFVFHEQRSPVEERAIQIRNILKQALQYNPCPPGKDPVEHYLDVAARAVAEQEQRGKGQQGPTQRGFF